MINKYMDLHNKGYLVTVGGSLASLAVSGPVVRDSLEEQVVVEQNLKLSEGLSHLNEDEESGEIGLAFMNSLGDGKIRI